MNSHVFFCPTSRASEEKRYRALKKHLLVRSKKGRIMEEKICYSGNNEKKFPSICKMRMKYLMLSIDVKLPGGTIRKLAKTEEKSVV